MKVLWGVGYHDVEEGGFIPELVTTSKEHAERIRDMTDKHLKVQGVSFFDEGEMPDIRYRYSANLYAEEGGKAAPHSWEGEVIQRSYYAMYDPSMTRTWNTIPKVRVQYSAFQMSSPSPHGDGREWHPAYEAYITGTDLDKVQEQIDRHNGMGFSELKELHANSKKEKETNGND